MAGPEQASRGKRAVVDAQDSRPASGDRPAGTGSGGGGVMALSAGQVSLRIGT